MDWTAIGIGISIMIGALGIVWTEIKILRDRAHKMDNIAQRIVTQSELMDRRQTEIISALDKVEENHQKLLDLVYDQSIALAVLTESIRKTDKE